MMAFLGLLFVIYMVYKAVSPAPPPKKLKGRRLRTNAFAEAERNR